MTQPEAPAETTPEATPDTAAAETVATETEPEPTQPKPTETVDFWKGKAREQEKRAKENATKAAEFDRLTEAAKSDLQRATERAEAAERRAAELESERDVTDWKARAAEKFGVPASVLRGSTADEINAHAESLKALLPEPRKPGQVPGEGRTVMPGKGDAAQDFAAALRQAGL